MGSKSSPSQSTQSSNINTSYGLQDSTGFFGNGNSMTHDNSRTDIFADNSDRSITEVVQSGQFAGANVAGNISVIDGGAFGVATDSVRAIEQLSDSVLNANSNLASDAIKTGSDLALNMTLENGKLARDSLSFGGDLARDFMAGVERANTSATDAIVNSNKYALQYADNQSRSDGQQLALSSNKTLMWVMLGFAGVGAVALMAKG